MDILLKQSKRQKITLTTFFAYGFIGLMILYQPQNAVLLLFCLIVGVLIWWSLELGLDYKNIPFVYCMPISWVLISYIFLATIQNQIITLMILIVFAILFHMLLLTLNLLVISNIKNIPLKKLWYKNPIFNQLRMRRNYDGKCGKCKFVDFCGGCRAVSFYNFKNLTNSDSDCFYKGV